MVDIYTGKPDSGRFSLHRRQKLTQELFGTFMLRTHEKIFG
jgi:hypothetical protein